MLKLSLKDPFVNNQVVNVNISTELEADLCFPLLMTPPAGVVDTYTVVLSYHACRLRAPCRLMLTGMLNGFRGDCVLRNMEAPLLVLLVHLRVWKPSAPRLIAD